MSQQGSTGRGGVTQPGRTITDYFAITKKLPVTNQLKSKNEISEHMYFPAENVTTNELINAGGRAQVRINDKDVALIYHKDEIFAIQPRCPHVGGPLFQGDIEEVPGCGPCIKCPWHKWTFSLRTGHCRFPRNSDLGKQLETFPVQLGNNGQVIKIGFKEISPSIFQTPPE